MVKDILFFSFINRWAQYWQNDAIIEQLSFAETQQWEGKRFSFSERNRNSFALLSKLNEGESSGCWGHTGADPVTKQLHQHPGAPPLIHLHVNVPHAPTAQTKSGSVLPPAGRRLHVRGGIHRGAVACRPAEPMRPNPDPGDPHGRGQERGREDQSCH